MIRSVRTVQAKSLAASLSNTALVHTGLRLHAVRNERVVNEDILLMRAYQRTGRIGRPSVTVLLEGEARISAHGEHVWLLPGDVVAVDSKSEIRMRQAGEVFASIAFEWEPGFAGRRGGPVERLRATDAVVARLGEIWRAARDGGRPAELVSALLAALAEIGVPVDRKTAAELDEPRAPHDEAITAALDRVLSNLSGQPMLLDLEAQLALSARQVNRIVAEYNQRYGFNSGTRARSSKWDRTTKRKGQSASGAPRGGPRVALPRSNQRASREMR